MTIEVVSILPLVKTYDLVQRFLAHLIVLCYLTHFMMHSVATYHNCMLLPNCGHFPRLTLCCNLTDSAVIFPAIPDASVPLYAFCRKLERNCVEICDIIITNH